MWTTDSFIKAFQIFGEDDKNKAVESDGDPGDASQPEKDEDSEEVEFADVSVLLNDDLFDEHLLNLIAMVDAMKATSNEVYKKV